MEKNTVLLDVKTYNDLRDFKQNIEEGYTIKINRGLHCEQQDYISTDQTFKEIVEFNKHIGKQLAEQIENYPINYAKIKDLQTEIKILKNMSLFEFIKWKRKKVD